MSNKERLFTEDDMDKAFRLGACKQMFYDVEDVEGVLEDRTGYKSFEDLISKLKKKNIKET